MTWKRFAVLSIVILFPAVLIAYFCVLGPDSVVYRNRIREGNAVIAQIEAFRSQRHRLPGSMEEAGAAVPDPQQIY